MAKINFVKTVFSFQLIKCSNHKWAFVSIEFLGKKQSWFTAFLQVQNKSIEKLKCPQTLLFHMLFKFFCNNNNFCRSVYLSFHFDANFIDDIIIDELKIIYYRTIKENLF